ncbi:MAG: PhzF family phenazine biosynthesis protein [Synoicihabitans sp.]
MSEIPFFWVDAFTDRPFGGNPAAVCPLQAWLPDAVLQKLAWQHGLSETAFTVRLKSGAYQLRWFTPEREVDLCGHATLASAHVLINECGESSPIRFESQSGPLSVSKNDLNRLVLNFPSRPPNELESPEQYQGLLTALGVSNAVWVGKSRDFLVAFADESTVANISPDFQKMVNFSSSSVIVTAPGDTCDFVSRNFAPGYGIDEDPVTGSAHCTLTPYWAEQLGKSELHARQISARGGDLWCELMADERVAIAGNAVTYLRGTITM